ncbi:coiled-coil domain-containing protein 157-like isoform X2 [Littorina saxatilis]|uniref:Uncharacterized protein n=1 Tax=Littorina saxatilis TaxID=31220 RepID=A0AAN9AIF4_9CAEN
MAEILGSKLCMESLQTDVQDVQWTINDISSRIGPLDIPSWKFPDKKSWELDMEQLLEMYSFSEDEQEENQVAHIALYELLIDRLVLLVQGTAVYLNQVQQLGRTGGDAPIPPSSSVGLAVKHFWSQLTNLQSLMQQLYSQNKTNARKITELEKTLKKASSENSLNSTSTLNSNRPADTPDTNFADSPPKEISCDESNKSAQTVETAFVPCEACDVVQKKMREAGDLLVDVCQKQALPSSLRKYRPQVSHVNWLTYNDVSRWMSEQNKDVQRLCKYIEQMAAEIAPLKAEVSAFEKETKKAEAKAKQCEKEMNLEKETQMAVQKQYEVKVQEKEKQHELILADLHRQKEELLRKHTTLATELDQRKVQTTELESELQQWQSKGQQLQKDLEEKTATATKLEGADREVVSLKQELKETKSKLDATSKTLAKEQGKNKSAAQHKQQVQAKQESMSERVQELGQENEDLRDQVNDLEEEKQELQDTLQETKQLTKQLEKEKKEQEIIMRNMKEEKNGLEKRIEETEAEIKEMEKMLMEAKERERLIIEYPDLNGPVNPDLQGTGNIVLDMEHQVQANSLRMQVLEEQNDSLQRSISKVRSLGQGGVAAMHQPPKNIAPVPLWKANAADILNYREPPPYQPPTSAPAMHFQKPYTPSHNQASKQTLPPVQRPSSTAPTEFFTVGKAVSENPSEQKRPQSGKSGKGGRSVGFVPVNATSIGAYKQIKKASAGSVQGRRPASGQSATESNSQHGGGGYNDHTTPMFVCENCDKMYTKARDLEIHRSYCTA